MVELPISVLRESKSWIFCFLALSVLGLFLNLGLFFRTVLDRLSRPCESVRCTLYVTHMLLSVTGSLAVFLSLLHTPAAPWMCLLADFLGGLAFQASVGCLFVGSILAFNRRNTEHAQGNQNQEQGLIQPITPNTSVTRELVALIVVWLVSIFAASLQVAPILRNPLENQTRTCQSLSLMSEHGSGWVYPFVVYVCVDGVVLGVSTILGVVTRCWTRAISREFLIIILGCCIMWTPCLYFGYLSFTALPSWMKENGVWIELLVLLMPSIFSPLCSLSVVIWTICRRNKHQSRGRPRDAVMERTRVESVYRRMDTQKVSMLLSEYLSSGNPLSPQEAIVLVSSLSQAIYSLHRLGMSPGAIDQDNVMIDCHLDGSIVKSHLMGMPVHPTDLGAQVEKDKEAIGRLFNQMMQHSKLHAPRDTSRTTSMKVTSRKSVRAREESRETGEGLDLRGRSLYSNVRKSYRKYLSREPTVKTSRVSKIMRSPSRKSRSQSRMSRSGSRMSTKRPPMARSQSEMLSIRVSRLSVRTMRSSLHEDKPYEIGKRKTAKKTTRKSKWFDNPAFQGSVEGPESPFSPDTDSTYTSEGIAPVPDPHNGITREPIPSIKQPRGFRSPALAQLRQHVLHESLDEGDECEDNDEDSLIARFSRKWKKRGLKSSGSGLDVGIENPMALSAPTSPTGDQMSNRGTSIQKRRPSANKLSLAIPPTRY